jgi:hypothetical protein
LVMVGGGFWASAMRGFLTGLLLLGRKRPYEARMFANTNAVAPWLVPIHGKKSVAMDAKELEALLLSLQSRPSITSAKGRARLTA